MHPTKMLYINNFFKSIKRANEITKLLYFENKREEKLTAAAFKLKVYVKMQMKLYSFSFSAVLYKY